MARLPRSTFPEYGVWHATTRGVERRKVYLDRDDGREFLAQLWRAVDRFRLDVYGLCLMPNHYHFVVECSRDLLSRALHRVNGLYAQGFNAKYRRTGHLWGDRFALWQVRDDEHLESTCAYVRANPVRAGLCSSARRLAVELEPLLELGVERDLGDAGERLRDRAVLLRVLGRLRETRPRPARGRCRGPTGRSS